MMFASGIAFALPVKSTSALSGGDFNPGYIIDDTVFFSGNAMDTGQIQQFLNSKVPVCDTNHAGSGENQPPFICLKDYRQDTPSRNPEAGLCNGFSAGNKSAAEIIYEVGVSCGVSQKALLVLLQKEQSLITDTWPWQIQYRSATGYGCPDTAPCDSEYYGFFNQVYAAARQFKRYVRDSTSFNFRAGITRNILFNPNANCGSSPVYLQNSATAALYNYTPYQPNSAALANLYGTGDACSAYGNRNFWRIFTDWFGTTKPAGKWLRQDSTGQVWLVAEGLMPDGSYARKRFKLSTWEHYKAYFLQYEPVVQVSDDYLSQYTDDGVLGTMAIGRSYQQIQFMDSGHRFHIATGEQCAEWGLSCFDTNVVKTIPGTEFLERLPGTGPLRSGALNNGITYRIADGKRNPVLDSQTYFDLGYGNPANIAAMQSINLQQPIGTTQISHDVVIQFNQSSPVMYYASDTYQFHVVPIYDVFLAWNFGKHAYLSPTPSSYTVTPPQTSPTNLTIWATDGTRKYMVDQGRKVDVTATADMPNVTWQNIAKQKLAELPNAVYGSYAINSQTGSVFLLENGQKRQVPTWDDFVKLDLRINQLLPLSDYTLSLFPTGPLKLAEGTVFDDDGLFIVSGPSKYRIPSPIYFDIFDLDWYKVIVGQTNLDTFYTGTNELSVLIKAGSGQQYAAVNRNKYSIDSTARFNWGFDSNDFIELSDKNLNRLPTTGSIGRFMQGPDGKVYYGQAGERHHILSYSTVEALGGNSKTILNVPSELLEMSPLGSPIP